MAPGSKLVTLSPLAALLGPTRTQRNDKRVAHELPRSNNASFYECEEVILGVQKDTVSWSVGGGSEKEVKAYVYTRVNQDFEGGDKAVFLCCDRDCPRCKSGEPIEAVKYIDDGERVVINSCDECGRDTMVLRRRKPAAMAQAT